MFGDQEKNSLNYTLQKESLKVKKDHEWMSNTSPSSKKKSKQTIQPALFGAVCSLQDSPYRIFRVSVLGRFSVWCHVMIIMSEGALKSKLVSSIDIDNEMDFLKHL
jgi:hypothetical protein